MLKTKNNQKHGLDKAKFIRRSCAASLIVFVFVFFGLALSHMPNSDARSASMDGFDAGNIIEDAIFYNPNTMTVDEIQALMDREVPACDMWGEGSVGGRRYPDGSWVPAGTTRAQYAKVMRERFGKSHYHEPPYVCVDMYYQNPETGRDIYDSKGKVENGMISSAQIVYNAAHEYGVNPQVLLVMLAKESLNWRDNWPLHYEYNTVMGYGCPDGAPCASEYFGFYNQVNKAAWQMKYYREHIYSYNYRPGMTNNILYHPNRGCGTKSVDLANSATTSLYIYTPYTPNNAALDAYPGTGDGCSSYGNRNFYGFFREWFGDTSGQYTEEIAAIDKYYQGIGGESSYFGKPLGETPLCSKRDGGKYCRRDYEAGVLYYRDGKVVEVSGGMLSKYRELGYEGGALGLPLAGEDRGMTEGYARQRFEHGAIYWNANRPTVSVAGKTYALYNSEKQQDSYLGYPLADVAKDNNRSYQQFEHGRIYENQKDAWDIPSYLQDYWHALADANPSWWEVSKSRPVCEEGKQNCHQDFYIGTIYTHAELGTWTVSGGIGSYYKAQKAEQGLLGYPKSGEIHDDAGRVYQQFANGRIYWTAKDGSWIIPEVMVSGWEDYSAANPKWWGVPNALPECNKDGTCKQDFYIGKIYAHPEYGAWGVSGGIGSLYNEQKAEQGLLGYPKSGELQDDAGRTYQQFANGRIYWTPEDGSWLILESMCEGWEALAKASPSWWGVPKDMPSCAGQSCRQEFYIGAIYSHPEYGAWGVSGGIGSKYEEMKAESGLLGYPKSGEIHDDAGRVYQQFANGCIYWTPEDGSWVILDSMQTRWEALAAASKSWWGTPVDDPKCNQDNACSQKFYIGTIYSHPELGAWGVSGGIGALYDKMGASGGELGYPKSGEQVDDTGRIYQQFEHGTIYWTAAKGAWAV